MSVHQFESLQWEEVNGGTIAVSEVHLVVDEEHVGQVGQGELGSDVVALLAGEDVGLVGGDRPVSVLITGQHFQTGIASTPNTLSRYPQQTLGCATFVAHKPAGIARAISQHRSH